MLVRSSRYYAALVALNAAELARENAIKLYRQSQVEVSRLTRALDESRGDQLQKLVGKNVIVHAGVISIEGILMGVYPESVVLRHAQALTGAGAVTNLAGDQVIERSKVTWVQEPSEK